MKTKLSEPGKKNFTGPISKCNEFGRHGARKHIYRNMICEIVSLFIIVMILD